MSCGSSGVVRLWNTLHSHLVGEFTAHNRDLGSITMAVSPCGKYLVTADGEGTLKTWDIQVIVTHKRYTPTESHPKTPIFTRKKNKRHGDTDIDRESDGDGGRQS